MMRYLLAALALLSMPAVAQDSIPDRLTKARTEVNTATNIARSADETWCKKADPTECRVRVHNTVLALRKALYAVDKAIELAAPVPTPAPIPEGADFLVDFDIAKGLGPSWGNGAIPQPYTPDRSEGAFRFTCGGKGKLRYDDPVLFPGQPGKSHLHQPWGNADFTAFTTPESLQASAATDCNDTPYSLNRSLYWQPALVHDSGVAIQPDLIAVYYKRASRTSPACTPGSARYMGQCVTLPNQIRFIFGWNSLDPTAKFEGASWYCTGGSGRHFKDLDSVWADGCKAGDTLVANTIAPNCWNGKDRDAADHRSHMAYPSYGDWGYLKCPASHPFVIPQQENKAMWTVTFDMPNRVGLPSDHMLPGAKRGETLHADYIETWDARAKAMWVDNCIDKGLSCSGGDLGNGKQLIGASQPAYGWLNPSPRVPVPAGGMM